MNESEIRADLRLQLNKLGQDTAQAAKIINSGLASSVKGIESYSERDDKANDHRANRLRITRNREKKEADEAEYRADVQMRWNQSRERVRESQKQIRIEENEKKRSRMQALYAVQYGLAGVGLGLPGLGAIGALSQLNPALMAVVGSLRALGAALNMTTDAAARAHGQYTSALYSGYGVQATTSRNMMARVLGVSENDVYQFANQVAYLNPRLKDAARILADTNPVLTQLSWNQRILSEDWSALKAKIAVDLAPAFTSFIAWIDKLIKKMTGDIKPLDAWEQFSRSPDPRSSTGRGILEGHYGELGAVGRAMRGRPDKPGDKNSAKSELDYINSLKGKAQKDFLDKAFGNDNDSKLGILNLAKKWNSFKPEGGSEIPPPASYMKQLPASGWERMGLIVGGGTGVNYQRNVDQNTRKANDLLGKLPAEIAKAFTNYMNKNPNGSAVPALP